jgi:uncharacterized protein (DUF2235 family)
MAWGEAAPSRSGQAPKALVVLSDGTGNSALNPLKTNVWRLYRALDLQPVAPEEAARGTARQIAYYDNGVGTSPFRLLALLGDAVGWPVPDRQDRPRPHHLAD